MKTHYQTPVFSTPRMQSRSEGLKLWLSSVNRLKQIHKEIQSKRKAFIERDRLFSSHLKPLGE